MNDFDTYLNYKLIESIINDNKVSENLEGHKSIILNKEFILVLSNFVEKYVKNALLDKSQLDNLNNLINYIRFNFNTSQKVYNHLFNHMIYNINKSDSSEKYIFNNFVNRFSGHGILKYLFDYQNYPYMLKKIKKSISMDYFYLVLLTKNVDEKFYKIIDKLALNEYFLMSINQIIFEYPDILKDKVFVTRLKSVININLERLDDIENNEKRKIIKKRSNYYYNYIKKEE